MTVTVVERRAGAIDKACGEGLMPAALHALHGIGVDPAGVTFRGIRYLDAHGRRQVHARLPDGPGRGVRRTILMKALQGSAADAGVELVNDRVAEVEQDETGVGVILAGGGSIDLTQCSPATDSGPASEAPSDSSVRRLANRGPAGRATDCDVTSACRPGATMSRSTGPGEVRPT